MVTANDQTHQYLTEAEYYASIGSWKEAIISYDKALALTPNDEILWYNRGIAEYKLGKYSVSLDSFDRAVVLNPNFADAWFYRGFVLSRLGLDAEAVFSFDKGIALNPDDAQVWFNRGYALGKLGKYDEGITSYDKAIAIDPNYFEAWNNRGKTLYILGRYPEAIASFDKAIAIQPTTLEPVAYRKKALALNEENAIVQKVSTTRIQYQSQIQEPQIPITQKQTQQPSLQQTTANLKPSNSMGGLILDCTSLSLLLLIPGIGIFIIGIICKAINFLLPTPRIVALAYKHETLAVFIYILLIPAFIEGVAMPIGSWLLKWGLLLQIPMIGFLILRYYVYLPFLYG